MTVVWAPVHPQVQTSQGVWVDELIAPLLEALWAQDLDTEFSCQGLAPHKGYIAFVREADADRFVEATPHAGLSQQGRFVDLRSGSLKYLARMWGGVP